MFGAFSLVGGLASDPGVVIAARLLQGLGAGTLNPQVLGLLHDLYSGAKRAKALGFYAAAGGFAAVCGPIIGGLVLSAADAGTGWRVLFLVNVPLVAVLVPLAIRFLPAHPARGPVPADDVQPRAVQQVGDRVKPTSASIDGVGALLLGSVVVAFLAPTVYGTAESSLAWLAAGAVTLLCFAGWELLYQRRGRTPLLSAGLARSGGYLLGTVVAPRQLRLPGWAWPRVWPPGWSWHPIKR